MMRVSSAEIDAYVDALDEPKKTTLGELRGTIRDLLPDAEECLSYGMPAFKVHGKIIAGFAAYKNHLSYMPHSGSVISAVGDLAAGYTTTKGSLQFPVDQPLPVSLVRKLLDVRMAQAFGGSSAEA